MIHRSAPWLLRACAIMLAAAAIWRWSSQSVPVPDPAISESQIAVDSARPAAIADRLIRSLGIKSLASPTTSGEAAFEDVTREAGLTFIHDNDAHGRFYLPEQIGPGAAFLDYDNDGDLDIFIAGGGSIDGSGSRQLSVLYRNDGGRLTDVTSESNAGVNGPSFGAVVFDHDNDSDADIFVAGLEHSAFLRNLGDGRFEEVSARIGLVCDGFATGATAFDYNDDGHLDLYVCRYVDWRVARHPACTNAAGLPDYCSPASYNAPSTDRLYRNRGDGTFQDVSASAGIETARGNGLGVMAHDFNGDGHLDLYVANDASPAFLWHNNGDGTFSNLAEQRGCAFDGQGIAIAGMGVACEDFDGDADFDLLVTNIRNQSHLLLEHSGGQFIDASAAFGVPSWSNPRTGFGVVCFDQDHDGELDMIVANGAVNTTAATARLESPFAEPQQLLRLKSGRFVDDSAALGLTESIVGRALAMGDYDNDGDVDVLITDNGSTPRLLRNTADRTASDNNWLTLDIRGSNGKSPAIGARVECTVAGKIIRREVRAHGSYLASHDPRVHLGLGLNAALDKAVITWPDGRSVMLTNIPSRQRVVVTPSTASKGVGTLP